MSEFEFTEKEINEVWSDLNSAKKELELFETKDAETKKQLIIRIRDKVDILVKAEKYQLEKTK